MKIWGREAKYLGTVSHMEIYEGQPCPPRDNECRIFLVLGDEVLGELSIDFYDAEVNLKKYQPTPPGAE